MKAALKELRNYRGIAFRWFLALVLVSPATPLRSDEQTAVTSTGDATINQAAPAANNGAATTISTHTALAANQRSLPSSAAARKYIASPARRIGQKAASPGTRVTALPPGRRRVAILIPRRPIRGLRGPPPPQSPSTF